MTNFNTKPWSPTLRFPKRIVILGNDVAAWMAATLLARSFAPLQFRITVCPGTESVPANNGKTFTSSPALPVLLQNLGIDEHDMLKACNGTYRLATQFSDWAAEGRDFWQPIGTEHIRIDHLSLFDAWAAERIAGRLLRPLHSYSPHWTASLAGKAPHSFSGTSAIASTGQYGFHGDASGLAAWFRLEALKSGVEELTGDISKQFPNGRAGIAQVKLSTGKPVPGDLFVDCRRPTADHTADSDDELELFSDQFPADRSVSFTSPATRQIHPFTRITAHKNGWSSTIPLADSIQHRYVFCSRFQTDAEAAEQLQNSVNARQQSPLSPLPEATFEDVTLYQRRTFWQDNVIHLGRSAMQFEDLAATSMHLDHVGIDLLLELFPDRHIGKATRHEYNVRMTSIAQESRSYLRLHHALANRADSEFGKAVASTVVGSDLDQTLAVYDATGVIKIHNPESIPAAAHHGLLAGCGRLPKRPTLAASNYDSGRIQSVLREIIRLNEAIVKDLPLHEELLDWIHTGPFQQKTG